MSRSMFCCFVLVLVIAIPLCAGVDRYYSFAYGTQAYVPIQGTLLPGLQADNAYSSPIDIGFAFPYCGGVYTNVRISSNGWINPGANLDNAYSGNMLNYGISPIISPLWDDLGMGAGNVQYLSSGVEPYRCFTVQYYHAWWDHFAYASWFDFQVSIYETGLIEFKYGSHLGNPVSASASIGVNMSRNQVWDFFSISPGSPPTASTTSHNGTINSFPETGTIYSFVPLPPVINDLAVTAINRQFYLMAGEDLPYGVTVKNLATQPADTYDVVLYNGFEELCREPGTTLNPQESYTYVLHAVIDSSGFKQLRAVAELAGEEFPADNGMSFTCILRPDAAWGHIFGAGDELVRIPYDFYWKYSLYEAMYYPDEVGSPGMIYGISFFNYFQTYLPCPVKLWIGESTLSDLSADWVPATQLCQVVDYEVEFPVGLHEVYLPFSTPYSYNGGNLVIMAYQANTWYNSGNDKFKAQTLPELRARNRYSDTYNFDANNPPAGTIPSSKVPKIAFYISPGSEVEDATMPSPATLVNYPNPFRSNTVFSFSGVSKDTAKLEIYNLKGQRVCKLSSGANVSWDGCDDSGKRLAAGVYVAKLSDKKGIALRKICLID